MQAMAAGTKLIVDNRRARHEYHLLDRYEAGQAKNLNALEESYDVKARRMRNILAVLSTN